MMKGENAVMRLWPGFVLSVAVAMAGFALHEALIRFAPYLPLDAMVLALLIGMALAALPQHYEKLADGVIFAAKLPLELAIALMGASLSTQVLTALGWPLFTGIAATVLLALGFGYLFGRLMGLPWRMALLIATGNAICGNSAILALAPVIEAEADDVSAAVAFTAVIAVLMVLMLPFLMVIAHLDETRYGIIAGLSVYAVPQVLAATSAIGPLALQTGTVVKLTRVLLLGPLVFAASLIMGRETASKASLVPWFITGFLGLAALRSFDLVPQGWLAPMALSSKVLGVIAMAALGLSVDVRAVAQAGARVSATVVISLAALVAVSFMVAQLV